MFLVFGFWLVFRWCLGGLFYCYWVVCWLLCLLYLLLLGFCLGCVLVVLYVNGCLRGVLNEVYPPVKIVVSGLKWLYLWFICSLPCWCGVFGIVV